MQIRPVTSPNETTYDQGRADTSAEYMVHHNVQTIQLTHLRFIVGEVRKVADTADVPLFDAPVVI